MKNGDKLMGKLLDYKKIKKLNIDLFDDVADKKFDEYKEEYIKKKIKMEKMTKQQAIDSFDVEFPNIYAWGRKGHGYKLNSVGEQQIVEKINELICAVNKLQETE